MKKNKKESVRKKYDKNAKGSTSLVVALSTIVGFIFGNFYIWRHLT